MEKPIPKPSWELRLEAIDELLKRASKRKRKSIRKSMIRPLYQEILRTLFIIGAMLFDALIIPQIAISIGKMVGWVLFIIALSVTIILEIMFYNSIWGKKGIWGIAEDLDDRIDR